TLRARRLPPLPARAGSRRHRSHVAARGRHREIRGEAAGLAPFAHGQGLVTSKGVAHLIPSAGTSVTSLALRRMAFGAAARVGPGWFARAWIGRDAAVGGVPVITRSCAIRDLALGLGALIAIHRDRPVRGWVEAGILCDAVDAIVVAAGPIETRKKL